MGWLAPARLPLTMHDRELVGRTREFAVVEAFLRATDRLPAALMLVGEAGIGKTTVWERAVETARYLGFECLQSRPAPAEAQLAFAGLGDLLSDTYSLIAERLPAPQRRALGTALLTVESATAPDQRTIGVAVLSALRMLAADRPVLLAIDDEQWLDDASSQILGFALRRLQGERVAILLARRRSETGAVETSPLVDRVANEEVELEGVSIGALHAIIAGELGAVLSRSRLRRVHELSQGNPMLAIELVHAIRDGRLRLEDGQALTPRLDRLVGARIDALPAQTRTGLLAAAAATRPSFDLIGRVIDADARAILEPAAAAGIVEFHDRDVGFAHPLLASAAYGGGSDVERRHIHARLATFVVEPVEHARHLALAASSVEESVAEEVERAAEVTFRRGAPAAAAALAGMAVRLTPDENGSERGRRVAAQAEYLFESGDTAPAAALIESAIATTPPGHERAALLALLARIRHFGDDIKAGSDLNMQALAEASDDPRLVAGIHEGMAWGLFLTRQDVRGAAHHAQAAVDAASAAGDEVALAEALAVKGLTGMAVGRRPDASLSEAMQLESALLDLRVLRHPTYALAYTLAWQDRLADAAKLYHELLQRADDRGDESALPSILVQLSMVEALAGDWTNAVNHAESGLGLAQAIGHPPAQAALRSRMALLATWRGRLDEGRAFAAEALALAGAAPDDVARGNWVELAMARGAELALWALGAADVADGRFERAHAYLGSLSDALLGTGMREPGELRFLPDTVEALLGMGRIDEAATLVTEMEAMALAADRDTAAGIAARCRALVQSRQGASDVALEWARRSIALLDGSELPLERARSRLVMGELLRHGLQKRAARECLAAAIEEFTALGAVGLADRARNEAARIGGRPKSSTGLTPTESRVADLVSEGLANKEVAQALGITTKTVELHLSHVYAKLGVGSRTELVRLMAMGKS